MSLIYKTRNSPNISFISPFVTYFIKYHDWSCLVTQELKIRVKFTLILFFSTIKAFHIFLEKPFLKSTNLQINQSDWLSELILLEEAE